MQTRTATLLQACIDNNSYTGGKLLHAYILRTGLFNIDPFLSNRLIELYSKCNRTAAARHLFDIMPHRNTHSWHAMLCAYCRANRLADAYLLLDQMPERNGASWNNVISAMARNGYAKKAVEAYCLMRADGFVPTRFTLASLLSASRSLCNVDMGKECHNIAIRVGLDANTYVGNALITMYAKCRCIGDAMKVFKEMPKRNEVSFTAMMGGLKENDLVEEAFEMFKAMHQTGIQIDAMALSSILCACARGGDNSYIVYGKQIHGLTVRLGFDRDLHVNNSLLEMYAKTGDIETAEKVFYSLPEVSIISWNVMIGGYGQRCNKERAMEYMERMQTFGFKPDEVTYTTVLSACIKCNDLETARRIFDKMDYPSLSSWNALLSGYSQQECHREVLTLFREMQFQDIQFDRTTLAVILSSCACLGLLEMGKQVHAESVKAVFHTDVYVASGLIGMYSKCHQIELAKRIFYGVDHLDTVCWNSMIVGLSINSLDKEAFLMFKEMLEEALLPTEFTYATVMSCAANSSSLPQGRQVHGLIVKDGCAGDVFVGSALINMYCKCGDVEGAAQVFSVMPFKNNVTWNEMLHGYAQNGRGQEALHLYAQMILSGIKPDEVTFLALLTACSHSGLVDDGIRILNSMKQEYGVQPLDDHYACVIDSLGRAGRLGEIEALLDEMPCKDNPIIWQVLLSSCRIHSNVSLAKRAAEELSRLDPKNSAPFVLLANTYSSLERWEHVKDIREVMIEKQLFKEQGYSWVESKSEMYI